MSVDHYIISTMASSPSCEDMSQSQKVEILKQQIEQAHQLSKTPIVIIGEKGDLWLRSCPFLEEVNICYSSEPDFYSSLYDALEFINDRCFISPLCFSSPKRVWNLLERQFHNNQHRSDIELYYYKKNQLSYPLLLSPKAIRKMRENLKNRRFTSLNYFKSYNCTTLQLDLSL